MEQLNCTATSTCSSWADTSTRSTRRDGSCPPICARAPIDRTLANDASSVIAYLVTERTIGHSVIGLAHTLSDRCPCCICVDVTRTRAACQFACSVKLTLGRLRVNVGFEVLGVAPSAGTGIGSGSEDDMLRVGRVALLAGQCSAVLSRVLSRDVPEVQCIPVGIRVTGLALTGRGHVVRRLAYGACVVVTGRAARSEAGVIHFRGIPGQGAVARVALLRGRNVVARQS